MNELLQWALAIAALLCAVVWVVLWAWGELKAIDAPHTHDERLAQREIDMAKAHAEEERQHRPRVRAGRTL